MKLSRRFYSYVCIAAAMALSLALASRAATPMLESEVRIQGNQGIQLADLSSRILALELKLERLNMSFRIESTKQPRWRAWRQFVYSETQASCTEAGLITRMATSYPYMQNRPKGPSPSVALVEGSSVVSMVGQLFAAGGEAFEISSNLVRYARSKKKGLDPSGYRKQVKEISEEIEELLAQRDELLKDSSTLTEQELEIASAESKLLYALRDIDLSQYKQYHSAAVKLRFFQNTAYAASITKNCLGAASNMVAVESNHLGKPKLSGTASLLSLAAGAVTVATPVWGRASGSLAGFVDRRIVNKDFADTQSQQASAFRADSERFKDVVQRAQTCAHTGQHAEMLRGAVYERQAQLLAAQEQNIQRERKEARNTTVENVVFGSIVGSSRIAQGVTGMVGAWQYPDNRWMRARLTAAGSTAYGAGVAFNMIETARIRLRDELKSRALAKQHRLPSQVLKQRLDEIDEMKDSIEPKLAVAPQSQAL